MVAGSAAATSRTPHDSDAFAPAAWFRLAEALFHRLHVVDLNLQFNLTLPALQESTVAQLQDILQAADNLPNP